METTHSKNSRTKKPSPKIVVPSWDNIWESFNSENKKTTIEAMAVDGWKLVSQVAEEIEKSKRTVYDLVSNGKIESIKRKIFFNDKIREMTFVRPKI